MSAFVSGVGDIEASAEKDCWERAEKLGIQPSLNCVAYRVVARRRLRYDQRILRRRGESPSGCVGSAGALWVSLGREPRSAACPGMVSEWFTSGDWRFDACGRRAQ